MVVKRDVVILCCDVLTTYSMSNTFHSSTDSGRIPRIPAGIDRNLTGIGRDYPYLGYILLFYLKQMFLNWGIDQNSIIFTIFYLIKGI